MVMLHFAIANEQRELRELKHGFEPKTSGFSSSQKSKRCDFDLIVRTNVTDCTSESAVKTMPQYKWTLNSLSPPSSPAIRSSQTEALLEKRIVRPDLFPRREKIEDQLSLGSTVKVLSHHINSNILKNHIPKEHGVNERQSIEIPRERSTANYPSLFEKEHAYNYHLYAKESRHHELPSPIERKKERIQEPWLINSEYTTSFAPTSNYKSYFSDENLKHNDISKLERDELKRREAEKQLEHMEMRQEGFKFREYVSEPKPTPLEIEKAVNYLKTLEDKRIEKKQKSVWAKTRALVGLKKKDYDNKYYKNILESIRRGVIPGEVSTLIAINQFNERQQLNEECVKPSKKVRKADKSEKQISQNSSDTQKVYLKVHAKVDIELRSGGGTVTKGDMARRHEFGPPVEDDPVVPLGQLFLLDEWDTKLPARVKMTREGLFRVLYKIVGDFNTERNNADSVVLMHPQFVEDFFKLEKQLENEPKSKESEPETLDELEEEEEGKIYRGLLEPEIKMTHEELVKCYACFSGGLRQMNRAVIPVFRAAHFVLVHVGRDANEDVHAHIMDSKLSESKNPYISDEEARHIAGFLFNAAAEDVKISRAGKTLIPYQKNNVDCGLHTIWSAEACLRDDRFNPDIQRLAVTRNPDKETMQQVRARISRMLKDMLDEERRDDRGQDEDLPENKETLSHSITSEKTSRVRLTEKRKIEEESEAAIGEPVKKASSKFFKGWRKEKEHDVKPNKTRSKTGKFAAQEENKSNDHEIVDQKSNLHVLLNPVNSLLASAKRRKDLKVLQRIKSILEKATNESQAPGSSTTTDSSESGESYSPEAVTHNNRWLTTEQKKELVEKFDKKKSTLKQLIRIYCLSKNEQYARTQISRYRTELQTGKPNTRQAHSQLAKRTASMLEHADKVEMAEIHEKDIERLGLQQSVCFGLKNFKASNFWVHTTKGRSNFVSRHIDLRLAKTPKPGALTVEQKVDMFRRQELKLMFEAIIFLTKKLQQSSVLNQKQRHSLHARVVHCAS
ncbi:unnamed protein product [Caenorhabditis brenneri]